MAKQPTPPPNIGDLEIEGRKVSELYWTGGPAQIRVSYASPTSEADSIETQQILEDFRSQCQWLWFAFDGMINGRPLMLERWRQQKVARHSRLFVGTQFPEQEQSVGKSTFAQITFGELLDSMAAGGEFERLNAKAYLVFIDALWEDSARKHIANVLQVKERDVKCDLLADLRRLRNLMLHRSEKAKQDYVEKATLLPQIWDINPDDVIITSPMLQAFIEQLSAIHVHVEETADGHTGTTSPVP